MKRLQNDIKNFTNVVHIADIHCRLTQRIQEYEYVFDKLYKAIDRTPDTTLILVAGDICHNKVDLTPESIQLMSNFLKRLADKRPTILIAGNHDALLSNKNRLDSLSPIVESLNHSNLYYLKDTDVYIIGDVLFNNYSVFDSADKYTKYKDIPAIYKNEVNYNIALFHGPVNNAVTDVGYVVSSRTIMVETFDGHQMAMLGDIHKHQVLQEYNYTEDKPAIVYCGSLIQQDHGEELKGHGFVYWELKTKKFVHVEIPNDYGFYTIEVNKGVLTSDIKDIPKKAKLRIKCIESVPTEIKSIISNIRKVTDITDVSYVRIENNAVKNIIDVDDFNLQNVSDVDYQNNLIKEYFDNKNITVSQETLECINGLNKELNEELKKDYIVKNIRWKPKIFEFDNMFSYGEDNVIDFTKMNGVMGLFANNAAGKSSILSALSFCLFDKCDRTFKASYILNNQKMSFRCKFNFEISGTDFFIERKGGADKKGNVKVEVKFWKVVDGKEVELNGEARRSTNDIIRDYIGEYEDFILTVLSVQNSRDGSFVDMGQTERKDLLAQFMGLNIFDNLYNLANENYKETSILLKNFNNQDYTLKLHTIENNIIKYTASIKTVESKLESISRQKEENNNKLIDLTKQLVNVGINVLNITSLERNKIELTNAINADEKSIQTYKDKLTNIQTDLDKTLEQIKVMESKNLNETLDKYNFEKNKYNELNNIIEKRKILIKNKLDKLAKLEEHKYDPNCSFCTNNIFVKDAIKTKEELENDKNEIVTLLDDFKTRKNNVTSLEWVLSDIKIYDEYKNTKSSLTGLFSKVNELKLTKEHDISNNKNSLSSINLLIDDFYKQKDNIENNTRVNADITEVKNTIKNLESEYKTYNTNMMTLNSDLNTNINNMNVIKADIEKIKILESKNDCYKYYIQSVSRDGIPYDLISQAIPTIEKEVNAILHQIVEFTIMLKTDGKIISTYIVYDDKKWPLEMSSGLEKFISSLAIRVALINISNLPRPSFIAIDEGFGCADRENMASMANLFGFLKTKFDFIWIISHLDEMRDMVDKHIEIKKENGFSKIVFT